MATFYFGYLRKVRPRNHRTGPDGPDPDAVAVIDVHALHFGRANPFCQLRSGSAARIRSPTKRTASTFLSLRESAASYSCRVKVGPELGIHIAMSERESRHSPCPSARQPSW